VTHAPAGGSEESSGENSGIRALLRRGEDVVSALAILAIVLLPVIEILGRATLSAGIRGSIDYVRHLTLWIGFLGAALAARSGRHLALGFAHFASPRVRLGLEIASAAVGAAVSLLLAWVSLQMVRADMQTVEALGGIIPVWIAELVMPVGFAVIGLRLLLRAPLGWRGRGIALAGILLLAAISFVPEEARAPFLVPGLVGVGLAALAGAPIFSVLGGAALLLFFVDGSPPASIPVEAYRIASNPILPTIPLFTLAGTILAETKASQRLVRLFRAFFGWMPGGAAVATILACAFFTTFNGGSGVTILAMGALMFPVLVGQGFGDRFSLGALTASGSLGILLPPSLLVILYGVSARVPIDDLFLAGIAPGLLLIVLVGGFAMLRGRSVAEARAPFDLREAVGALWEAKWETFLPVLVLGSIFSGFATLVEAASLTACYVLFTELVIHRGLSLRRDIVRIFAECATMVGGILVILATAMGLTDVLIYTDVPTRAAEWVQSGIESRWVFLLALNGFLLIVGCLMDIFSAIVVVVPLIAPVAREFEVDPLHLGIIFLANMELGYLTPPVGMNLFLASFRFNRPLWEIFVAIVPFFLLLLVGVLLITYVPALTTGVVAWLGG
jgi:C4-dicarboxylate transporter DctM subunit